MSLDFVLFIQMDTLMTYFGLGCRRHSDAILKLCTSKSYEALKYRTSNMDVISVCLSYGVDLVLPFFKGKQASCLLPEAAENIDLCSIKDLWGNLIFDHVVGPSVGCSRDIVCVWDPNMFVKEYVSSSDYFVALMGTWTPTSTKLLIISFYAPHELTEKQDLWDYLRLLIDRWEGNIVIMGLIDLPLEGYTYTWVHKSASKMSKLDRFLISKVDKIIDQGMSNEEVLNKRIMLINELQELNSKNAIEISQKAKIRWSFEDQVKDLEHVVTYDEVKRAVWDCGASKSPSPVDFLLNSIVNIRRLLIKMFFSDVPSAFVSNRQILDGPFILNKLLSWCKYKKVNGMIFKVDFEKDFDSVKWDYLDETLKAFGFGQKWCRWISGCLNNATGSVFVNGLKINLHKSKLMGVGVSSNVVEKATTLIGCSTLTSPFKYLDVKVGGGHLTLLKSLFTSIPLYHMSIFKVSMDYREDDSWSDIILDDIYNTFYKDKDVAKEVNVAKEP
ncbi:RNA-directed DNA polymerase, eukaryota [Tanacetum coccineum]